MCKWGTTVRVRTAERIVDVDECIAHMVQALNDAGFPTIASCCGHGRIPTTIAIADDRWIVIVSRAEMERIVDSYGIDIHGAARTPAGADTTHTEEGGR